MTDATTTATAQGPAAPETGDALEAVGLTAGYGRNMVLRDVTVRVGQGEFVSLIGANGAGKSTLFKCLSGHIRPKTGRVRLFGEDLGGKAPHEIVRAGLGEVPEGRHVFSGLTVAEHLRLAAAFGARARGEDAAALTARVYETFPLLRDRSEQDAGTMSGGQQQMLVISRALMTHPRALMLDEPSLGLAPLAVEGIFAALRELNRSGVAILLIEQNAMAALRLANRAYVLENGRVVREGSGAELAADRALIEHYVGGTT